MLLGARLRHRIRLEVNRPIKGPAGDMPARWELFIANLPAEIESVSGRELVAGGVPVAEATHKITIRYLAPVNETMRVVHDEAGTGDATIYNIRAVVPDRSLRRQMTLFCTSGVNDGR